MKLNTRKRLQESRRAKGITEKKKKRRLKDSKLERHREPSQASTFRNTMALEMVSCSVSWSSTWQETAESPQREHCSLVTA